MKIPKYVVYNVFTGEVYMYTYHKYHARQFADNFLNATFAKMPWYKRFLVA